MKFAKKGNIYFLGDANARLGTFTNDLNIHGSPITNKNKPLFMGFTEYCGLTLLNNVFAKGTPTYEIPNLKRSIIDMGITNSLQTVSNFKVLRLNMGVTSQTCHKALELSIKLALKPVKNKIPPYQIFNSPGNRHKKYLSSILCKFLDLTQISIPDHYHNIQSLFIDVKHQVLGFYEYIDRKKRNSQEIQNLQKNFKASLDLMSAEKTAVSVIRAKISEKALYLCFTKQRDMKYRTWLKKLESLDYSQRTRLLFSELRAKNRGLETFNAIKNREGTLSKSQEECLSYWKEYCQDLYSGHKSKNIGYVPIEN